MRLSLPHSPATAAAFSGVLIVAALIGVIASAGGEAGTATPTTSTASRMNLPVPFVLEPACASAKRHQACAAAVVKPNHAKVGEEAVRAGCIVAGNPGRDSDWSIRAMKVLVAGTARCGSTWAANVLGRAADTRIVYEPDGHNSDILGAVAASRLGEYPILEEGTPSYWYRLIWDLAFAGGWPWDKVELARAAGRRLVHIPPRVRDYLVAGLAEGTRTVRSRPRHVVVKSVNSIFSLDWIAERYAPRVVILRRNPLNIVSSWLVLGMWTEHAIGNDPLIRERYCELTWSQRAEWNVLTGQDCRVERWVADPCAEGRSR